jgi:hypothetical protein
MRVRGLVEARATLRRVACTSATNIFSMLWMRLSGSAPRLVSMFVTKAA